MDLLLIEQPITLGCAYAFCIDRENHLPIFNSSIKYAVEFTLHSQMRAS